MRDCRDGEKSEAVNFSSLVCRVAHAACIRWEKGEEGGGGFSLEVPVGGGEESCFLAADRRTFKAVALWPLEGTREVHLAAVGVAERELQAAARAFLKKKAILRCLSLQRRCCEWSFLVSRVLLFT